MENSTVDTVRRRLAGITARSRRLALAHGVVRALVLSVFLVLFLLYLDTLLAPESLVLIPVVLASLFIVIWAGIRWVYRPWARIPDPDALARGLERRIPAFQGRLIAAMEESMGGISEKWGYSRALRMEAFRRADVLLGRLRTEVVLRRLGIPERSGSATLIAGGGVGLLVLAAGLFLAWPVSLEPSLGRVANPLALYHAERTWDLEVQPGNIRLMRDKDLAIEVGGGSDDPSLRPVVHVESNGRWRVGVPKWSEDDRVYRYVYGKVDDDLRYRVTEGRRESPMYHVDVMDPPAITELNFRIEPPDYTGMPPREVRGDVRDLYAPKGSRMVMNGRVNKPLKRSYLAFALGKDVDLHCIGDLGLTGRFRVTDEDSFRAVVIDSSGIRGGGDRHYRIHIVDDRAPEVSVLVPGEDREIDRTLEEVLRFHAVDDFGLIDLDLQFVVESRAGGEKEKGMNRVVSFDGTVRDTAVEYYWDLKKLGLLPGERVRYRCRVRDNDGINGHKSGWSRRFVFRLPTIAEILTRRKQQTEETISGIRGVAEETRRLRETVESLERDLSASNGVDWEGREEASEIMEKQNEVLGELRSMTDRFQKRVENMEREGPVSSRLIDRAEEVSALFQAVATPEMKAAIEKLRAALENIDPERVEKALKDLKLSEEEMLKGLDKTYRALKRLQIEQDLETLARQAAEILGRQEVLNAKFEDLEKANAERLRGDEKLVSADTRHLLNEMDRVSEELDGSGEAEAAGDLSNLSDEMADRGLERRLGEIVTAIEGEDSSAAVAGGKESAEDMRYLAGRLEGMKDDLIEEWKRGVAEVIDRAVSDLLSLSSSQEDLVRRISGSNGLLPANDSLISEESILLEGLEGVAEDLFHSTEETFFLGRDVGQKVGGALNRMRHAARQLESGGGTGASTRRDLKRAMTSLNGAVVALMRDKASMMQSSSGTGLEEAFQQMMDLARAQTALNEKTVGMFPLPLPGRGGEGMPIGERLLQMAAEQRRIGKELEALEGSLPGQSGALGRLDRMIDEMDRVAEDLGRGHIDERVIDRQRRILSRLLDAEKSIRERDYSRKREAEKAKAYEAVPPPPIPSDVFQEEEALSHQVFPMADGTYPEGYAEIIRAYFRELMKGVVKEDGQ